MSYISKRIDKIENIKLQIKMYDILKQWKADGVQCFNATKLGQAIWGNEYIMDKDLRPDGYLQGESMTHVTMIGNFFYQMREWYGLIKIDETMYRVGKSDETYIYTFTDTEFE